MKYMLPGAFTMDITTADIFNAAVILISGGCFEAISLKGINMSAQGIALRHQDKFRIK